MREREREEGTFSVCPLEEYPKERKRGDLFSNLLPIQILYLLELIDDEEAIFVDRFDARISCETEVLEFGDFR